jgi:excinuclease ABC subunit A
LPYLSGGALQRRGPRRAGRRPVHSRCARPERAHDAVERFAGQPPIAALRPVSEVGLGYLKLGEATPSLSGGESQRLKIASRLRRSQRGALYVFDELTTGLHPLDVATLVGVFDQLLDAGATIMVIEHGLDLLAAADYLIDMGPGRGPEGGRIPAAGTHGDVARDAASVTCSGDCSEQDRRARVLLSSSLR